MTENAIPSGQGQGLVFDDDVLDAIVRRLDNILERLNTSTTAEQQQAADALAALRDYGSVLEDVVSSAEVSASVLCALGIERRDDAARFRTASIRLAATAALLDGDTATGA